MPAILSVLLSLLLWPHLQLMLARRVAGPMSLHEQFELSRRFATGYERLLPDGRAWKDTERVRAVRQLTAEYNTKLKSFGMRDYQVRLVPCPRARKVPRLDLPRRLDTRVMIPSGDRHLTLH